MPKHNDLNTKFWLRFLIILYIFITPINIYSQQRIKDFYLSNYEKEGAKDWELKGDEAAIYEKHVDIDKMNGNYYLADDTIYLKSDKAKINKENMNVYLKDNVYIENTTGMKLETDYLDWRSKENLIHTDDWVKAENKSMQIKAKGMEADTQLKKVDFEQNVEVKLPEEAGKNLNTITCRGPLEIEYNKGKAVFYKDVKMDSKDGKLFADKATAFFSSEDKKLIKIIAEGNVKIIRDENITFSEKATYLGQQGKIILEGNPRLIYFPKENREGSIDMPFFIKK